MSNDNVPLPAVADDMLRLLRQLARAGEAGRALGSSGGARPVAHEGAEAAIVDAARRASWVACGDDGFCRLTNAGRAHLRRALQRRAGTVKVAPAETRPATAPLVSDEESPISWLARRKDKSGEPLLARELVEAAERLRADFHFAGLSPSVTTNWAAFGGAGGRRSQPGAGVELRDATVAARERFHRALDAVGEDFAGLLVDVCCHLRGLEQIERGARWPQRSGRIVLTLALKQLARHYGILPGGGGAGREARPRTRHWGTADYRPTLETWQE